jgi:hypothetical protein
VFGKADLTKAYWQILLAESSRKHVAVRVDDRIYYPTRLPQGLKVSPQICQRVLTAVLRGANDEEDLTLLQVGRLLLYIDDLLFFIKKNSWGREMLGLPVKNKKTFINIESNKNAHSMREIERAKSSYLLFLYCTTAERLCICMS